MQLGRKLAEGYAVDISEETDAREITPEPTPEPTETPVATSTTEPAQV